MKTLSEKTLQAKYLKAKISEQESILLHKYMLCFSYLYGCIQIKNLWDIFKQYKEKITKEKFFDFVDITQREENDYLVINLNEAYSAEASKDTKDKLLVNKFLIRKFDDKYWYLYTLNENMDYAHGPYIPSKEELFKYNHDIFYENEDGRKLINFLCKFKSKGYEYDSIFDKKYELLDLHGNKVKGKYLKDIICLSDREKFNLKYSKGENKKEYLLKEASINCLEKILNEIKSYILIESTDDTTDQMRRTFEYSLNVFSLDMDEEDVSKFMDLYVNLINSSHRWCMFGWSSTDLRRNESISRGPIELKVGPNIARMLNSGEWSIEDLEKLIKDNDLDVTLDKNFLKH